MNRALHIADGFSLPLELVTESFAIVAKRRVGKSFLLRRIAEQLFKAALQVVIVDPKGDQWGIRSAADGKAPGLPFLIFGGEHGDVPLEVGSGELVAKLVVEERLSIVLDLSLFRKHEVATFVTSFAENLYRLKAREEFRTPVMVLLDEADAVAPQNPQKGEERMLGAIDDLMRRGGQRGIGVGVVTQRTAVLNKNVLTQAQILIALRTIAPQDIKAMKAWIDVHGTPEQRTILMESLPSLPRGDAWFWSPGWPTDDGIFKRVHVLPIETFDSGATPKAGEKRVEPKERAPVDVEALRKQMAETIERAAAQDPRALQRRVAELQAQVKKLEAAKVPAAKVVTKEVYVLKEGQLKRIEMLFEKGQKIGEVINSGLAELAKVVSPAMAHEFAPTPRPISAPTRVHSPPPVSRPPVAPRSPAGDRQATGDIGTLDKAQRSILAVLAQYPDGCLAGKLTLLAGYRWSGGFRNALSALRGAGFIEGSNGGVMRITETGRAALGDAYEPLPAGRALIDYWLNHGSLGACERAVLRVLLEHPDGLSGGELAQAAGYEWSGGFRNALSSLRTAGLLLGRNSEVMRASPELAE